MKANTVQCDIVSAQSEIFSGRIEFLSASGTLGELGIAPGHSPLLTSLKPAPLELHFPGGETEVFFISGGYLEVQSHSILILADTVQRASDLDEAAAEQARQAAETDIQNQKGEIDFGMGAARLAEAMAQLRTLRQYRQRKK